MEDIDRKHMDLAAAEMAVNIIAGMFGEVKRDVVRSRASHSERAENQLAPVSLEREN